MRSIAGVSGTLLPEGYLSTVFDADARALGAVPATAAVVRTVRNVWERASLSCGPATAVRALHDLVADPIFSALGFRVHDLSFGRVHGQAVLLTPLGARVALILLPWSASASSAWREVFLHARSMKADWAFVLAPPFLTLAHVSGVATRRRLDFALSVVCADNPASPFWALACARAFEPAQTDDPSPVSLLSAVVARANRFQDRVRQDLQVGVAQALDAIEGVMPRRPPRSDVGRLEAADRRGQALTLVYRVLFLLFAESRELVPVHHPIYGRSYSVGALCREVLAGHTTGCWDGLGAMTRLARVGCTSTSLHVPPFGGRLFARAAAPSLETSARPRARRPLAARLDEATGRALVALRSRPGRAGREVISYRDLGVEQLGAVYERLLDIPAASAPELAEGRIGRDSTRDRLRKVTGTFYTPQPLAEFIVRRTLAPLVHGASAEHILALRVVDPAMGSGACLIAACRYLAAAYERALIDEGRATPEDFDEHGRSNVRRLIAERCLAGVDKNPTAVELARLSLWLATLACGKPLGFLDHRLRVGHSLVGAWPADLRRLSMLPTREKSALPLFDAIALEQTMGQVGRPLTDLLNRRDDSIGDVRTKAALWRSLTSPSSPLEPWRRAASLWCARWFWPAGTQRPAPAETRALIDTLIAGDRTLPSTLVDARLASVASIQESQAFFHWPLEFPDVFYAPSGHPRPSPGFDAVIGNPPWEMLRRDEGRGQAEARELLSYVRGSGQFPSCDRGHLNLYQAFIDRAIALARPGGRVGMVVPWGLASDDGASALRARLLGECGLDTIVGLDNAAGLFPIHRGIRFVVFTATPGKPAEEIRSRFGVKTNEELDQLPEFDDPTSPAYPIRMTRRSIELVGGPLLRFPDVRQAGHLALAEDLVRRFPRLGDLAGWHVAFGRELNATESRPWIGRKGLPIIEGKHVSPFSVAVAEGGRIDRPAAERLMPGAPFDRPRLAYRDVSGVGNALSLIAAIVPAGIVTTHTLFCLKTPASLERQHFLCAVFNSYVMNAVVRLLMGGHVTTTLVESLAVPTWTGGRVDQWIAAAARRLAEGSSDDGLGPRLQARVAHRLGLRSEEFRRVLDGFPLVAAGRREQAWDAFQVLAPQS